MSDTAPSSIFVSLLIVTRNRPDMLRSCLESIFRNPPRSPWELIVVHNHLHDPVTDGVLTAFPSVHALKTGNVTPAEARNRGLSTARGEWICFLDDDVTVPSGYFDRMEAALRTDPAPDVVGGPDETPPDAGFLERAIGTTLTSPLATAHTRSRHSSDRHSTHLFPAHENDLILCNLWIRRRILDAVPGPFDPRFQRNEENVLIHQLQSSRCVLVPGAPVHHRRKTDWAGFSSAVFRSGYFRARSMRVHPASTRPIHAIPTLFLLFLPLLPLFPGIVSALLFIVYGSLHVLASAWVTMKVREWAQFPVVLVLQMMINVLYGAGFFSGFFSPIPERAPAPLPVDQGRKSE